MKRLINGLLNHFGMAYTSHILDQVKILGFQRATATSISLGIDDLLTVPTKGWLIQDGQSSKAHPSGPSSVGCVPCNWVDGGLSWLENRDCLPAAISIAMDLVGHFINVDSPVAKRVSWVATGPHTWSYVVCPYKRNYPFPDPFYEKVEGLPFDRKKILYSFIRVLSIYSSIH